MVTLERLSTFSVSPKDALKFKTTNFDRKFYIVDRFAKKQCPYHNRNNVAADQRSKIESSPLPASKKQTKEIHRNLRRRPNDHFYRLQLVYRCQFHSFVRSSIHSFNQSLIHPKINSDFVCSFSFKLPCTVPCDLLFASQISNF